MVMIGEISIVAAIVLAVDYKGWLFYVYIPSDLPWRHLVIVTGVFLLTLGVLLLRFFVLLIPSMESAHDVGISWLPSDSLLHLL